MIIFLLYFPCQPNFMALKGSFLKFSENYNKETAQYGLPFVTSKVSGAETFRGNFQGFPYQIISRASVNNCFSAF